MLRQDLHGANRCWCRKLGELVDIQNGMIVDKVIKEINLTPGQHNLEVGNSLFVYRPAVARRTGSSLCAGANGRKIRHGTCCFVYLCPGIPPKHKCTTTQMHPPTHLSVLIGYPLSHSFRNGTSMKFRRENRAGHHYELFPLEEHRELPT